MPEKLNMRRYGAALIPCSLVDEEELMEYANGQDITVTIHRQRSSKQNRFFWALLQKVCSNHDLYQKPEQLLTWLKVRLGYVQQVKFHDKEIWWTTKSISFNKMGQDEFRKFFDSSMDLIITEVIKGISKEDLIKEIESMVGFNLDQI